MDVVVLVKQVPATEAAIAVSDDGKGIAEGNIKWVISPYDEFAVEEGLRIREALGGTVTVISCGPDRVTDAIRSGLAMGADKGIHIQEPDAGAASGLVAAKLLAAAVKTVPHDLVIAGQRAVDDDNYLVGAAVAEYLGIPFIPFVVEQTIADGKIECRRTVEGGTVTVSAGLPLLFTTQRGLNEPRYVSMPGIMKAKKKPIDKVPPADPGADAPPVTVRSLAPPPERAACTMIDGATPAEAAEKLVKALREEAKVI